MQGLVASHASLAAMKAAHLDWFVAELVATAQVSPAPAPRERSRAPQPRALHSGEEAAPAGHWFRPLVSHP